MGPTLRNLLLRSLDQELLRVLSPHLRPVRLASGMVIGEAADCALFPETLVAAPVERAGSDTVALGLIGSEGVVGWPALLGPAPAQASVVQLAGGDALAIPTTTLTMLCGMNAGRHAALLRFVGSFTVPVSRTIVSTMRDPLDRRLARWIAMLHDRVDGDVLPVTHSSLADALGVRRATVTDALHILEGERVLRCTRALVHVRDRAKLVGVAGDAYGAAEAAYSAALAPFGKVARAVAPRVEQPRVLVSVV